MPRATLCTMANLACLVVASAQDHPGTTCADMEQVLLNARIGKGKDTRKGITRPRQVILDDGRIRHEAVIQNIDARKTSFRSPAGSELSFRDFRGSNFAGAELAKALEPGMGSPLTCFAE